MPTNKEQAKQGIIDRTNVAIMERELMIDYLTKMKEQAEKDNQPAFDMELDKLKSLNESDSIFLKNF
jgi:hypothetical protein